MKIDRHAVYEKYDGHCAYCGCVIQYKDMQVDHVFPKHTGGTDDIENLNPSCRICNHYKSTLMVDDMRAAILDMHRKLQKISIFRIAEKYGMVDCYDWNGKFYFEELVRHANNQDSE